MKYLINKNALLQTLLIIGVFFGSLIFLFTAARLASAVPPFQAPPGGNVPPPINQGAPGTTQEILGGLIIDQNLTVASTTLTNGELFITGLDELKIKKDDYYFFTGINRGGDDYIEIGAYHRTDGWKNLILNRDGGNIGIATTTPQAKLHVDGNAIFEGDVTLKTGNVIVSNTANSKISFRDGDDTYRNHSIWLVDTNTGGGRFGGITNYPGAGTSVTGDSIYFVGPGQNNWNDWVPTMTIAGAMDNRIGNVGVGTITPNARFTVNNPTTPGKVGSTGDAIYAYASSTSAAISAEQGNPAGWAGYFSGNVKVDGTLEVSGNSVFGESGADRRVTFWTGPTSFGGDANFVYDAGGRLGIGDPSPAALLTVGSGDLFQVHSTGHVRAIDGSAGSPSYSFTNDPDTGMYGGSSGILHFAGNGVKRVTVDANGLDVIGAIRGKIQDNGGEVYNVKNYGAKGDGVTDDHDAIVSALTSVANAGGGTVFLPVGNYYVKTQIDWPTNGSSVAMVGAGRGKTTLIFDVGVGDYFSAKIAGKEAADMRRGIMIGRSGLTDISNIMISDMTIRGISNSNAAAVHLIEVENRVYDSVFTRLEFKWAHTSGLRFSPSIPGSRTIIRDNYFHDINTSAMTDSIGRGGAALQGDYPNMQVTGNMFENTGTSQLHHATYFGGAGGGYPNLIISNNTFVGTHTRVNFFGQSSKNIAITGNVFNGQTTNYVHDVIGSAITGNSFYDTSLTVNGENIVISGNSFARKSTSGAGSYMIVAGGGSNRIHVVGNYFSDITSNQNYAIFVAKTGSTTNEWVIENNYLLECDRCISLDQGDNHVVKNNTIITSFRGEVIHLRAGSGHIVQNNEVKTGVTGRAIWDETPDPTRNTIIGNIITGGGLVGGKPGAYNATYVTANEWGNVGISQTAPRAKLTVNNPATVGKIGSAGDGIYVYANSKNAAISAEQADAAGYAGYFSGKLNVTGGKLSVYSSDQYESGLSVFGEANQNGMIRLWVYEGPGNLGKWYNATLGKEFETIGGTAKLTLGGLYSAGSVGIKTFSNLDTYTLNVDGKANATELCIAGDCKTTWGRESLWNQTGSDIYYNAGKVGVGKTNPGEALDVNGNIAVSGTVDGVDISARAPNWDTAFSERHQWDGSKANLDATIGRNSLGLGALDSPNFGGLTVTGVIESTSGGFKFDDATVQKTAQATGPTLVVCASNAKNKERCDYKTDGTADQVEITAAMSALPAGGGKVVLSEGTFTISSPITISKSDLTLEGQGWSTVISTGGGDIHILVIGKSGGAAVDRVTLRDIKLIGVVSAGSFQAGITFETGTNHLAERVWATDIGNSAFFVRTPNVIIHDCKVTNAGGGVTGNDNGATQNASNLLVQSCHFKDMHSQAGSTQGEAIYITARDGTGKGGVKILDNIFERTSVIGAAEFIDFRVDNGVIAGNIFKQAISGSFNSVIPSGNGVTIANNVFEGTGSTGTGLWLQNPDNMTITGNVFTNHQNGVLVGNGSDTSNNIAINSNTFINSSQNIRLMGPNGQVVINGNVIQGTGSQQGIYIDTFTEAAILGNRMVNLADAVLIAKSINKLSFIGNDLSSVAELINNNEFKKITSASIIKDNLGLNNPIFVDAQNQRVGIGHTAPNNKLHIIGRNALDDSDGGGVDTAVGIYADTEAADTALYAQQNNPAGYAGFFSGNVKVTGSLELSNGTMLSGLGSTAGTAAEGNKKISVTAGGGLTGRGDITIGTGGNIDFNIGAGNGIIVEADAVRINPDVVPQKIGDQTISGKWTFQNVATFDKGVTIKGKLTVVDKITNVTVENVTAQGSIIPVFDNSFDLGSSSKRWRDGYWGGNVNVAGNITLSGTVDGVDISARAPNWDTAFSERHQWDGSKANLDATIGRNSLGLGALATLSAVGSVEITDGTIASVDIADGTITNADIDASAAIAGTKITPDFGTQNIETTGTVNTGLGATEIYLMNQHLQTSNAPAFAGLTIDSTTLVVDAVNDRVGIGTTNPQTPLHIQTDSEGEGQDKILIESGHNNTNAFFAAKGNSSISRVGLRFLRFDGEEGGSIAMYPNTSPPYSSYLGIVAGNISFILGNSEEHSQEVMKITSDGNVGISQTNPSAKLAINNPYTEGKTGEAGDGIYVYANSMDAAISAEQGNKNGYAGNFLGKVNVNGPLSIFSSDQYESGLSINGASEENGMVRFWIYEGPGSSGNWYTAILGKDFETFPSPAGAAGGVSSAKLSIGGIYSTGSIGIGTMDDLGTYALNANGKANATELCIAGDCKTSWNQVTISAVDSALITDGTIVNADIDASAAIAGTKITPDFGTQNIFTNGTAGIGISSPSSKLHIKDGQSWGSDLSIDASGTAGGKRWSVISTGGDASEGPGKFLIKDNDSNAVRMTINKDGDVGIGTVDPQHTLDIQGAYYSRLVNKGDASGAITINWNEGNTQYITLTGDVVLTFTNGQNGGRYILMIKQDAIGGRKVTWPINVRWGKDDTPPITTDPMATDYIGFIFNGVDSFFDGVSWSVDF